MTQRLPVKPNRIDSLRKQCRHHNVFPIFLPNAFFSKEPEPVFRLLEEIVPTCVEHLGRLSPEDLDREIDALPPGLKMMVDEKPTDPKDPEYLERVALYQVATSLDAGYTDFRSAIRNDEDGSAVLDVYPELSKQFDDDGLLFLTPEFQLMDGGIAYRDHVIHYHQFLRRGFTSNPNFDFLGRFAAYSSRTSDTNIFRIAIDHRRIMHRDFYRQIGEFDGWFGPRFDRARLDDLNHYGLTVIERERPSYFDEHHGIHRAEFYWNSDRTKKLKTFEIEEVSNTDRKFDSYWVNRYIHSERDVAAKSLIHFDGAVKIYNSAEAYERRFASYIPKELRADRKIKLFRIDGDIDIEVWIELISFFFKGTEMVIRYFDEKQYEAGFRKIIDGFKKVHAERLANS